ncbi:MAG: hypothetical protein QOG36_1683 [Actinomycetota bacterium]|jgi:hypothetical protein|nr:hypothetical protein [Actinomycetota bacterium]
MQQVIAALPAVGIPLGILVGLLSGILSVLFLRTLQAVKREAKSVIMLIGQFAGIPALWLSVPFGSRLLADTAPSELRTSYVITLAVVWVPVVSWPMLQLIIKTANEIRSDDE